MAGREVLAHGVVEVEVNDRAAIARLNEIRAEYHRTMEAIDHDEAKAQIDANLAPLEDKVAQARRRLRKLEGERVTAKIEADKKNLDRQIKSARTSLKRLDGEKATAEIKAKGAEQTIAKVEAVRRVTEKRLKAEEKLLRQQDALAEKVHRANVARVNKEARMRESLHRQRLREETVGEREEQARQREIDQVPKLEAAYGRLQQKLDGLAKARRRARPDDRAMAMVDLQVRDVEHEMGKIRERVHAAIGRDPIHFDIMPRISERAGESIRRNLVGRTVGGALVGSAHELGQAMGDRLSLGFRHASERGFRNVGRDVGRSIGRSVGGGILNVGARLGHALGNISDMTVRLGPFTTTIKGLMIGLSLLGPVIVDVVGALGALVSVVGAAALGLGALSAGFLGGAIPSALGFGLVIKSVASEFQNVQKAQKAYDDAMRKGNTELAAKKMKELRATMGNVSEETVKQVGSWRKLQSAWKEATGPARGSVWKAIGEGIKTAGDLMPQFARRTNEGMGIAEKATTRWQNALRSEKGKGILNNMMMNFNSALGPVLNGMGSLIGYLGRVGEIASRSLPGLAHTFENWAKAVNSVDDTTLTNKVQKVIRVAKDLGNWFLAAGRLMKAFFSGGVDEGDNFVRTMTDAMNRWTAFLSTTEGQNKLHDFFRQSVQGVQALWSFLAPVVKTFVMWAEALAPLSRAFFTFLGIISQFGAKLLSITALRGPLTAIATTLGVLWGVGKISSAVAAVTAFTRALLGLAAAEKTVAAGGALMQGASLMGGFVGRGRAAGAGVAAKEAQTLEKTAESMKKMTAAQAAIPAVSAASGAAVGGLAAKFAAAEIVFGGTGAALVAMGSAAATIAVPVIAAGAAFYFLNKRIQGGPPGMQKWVESQKAVFGQASQGHQAFGRLQGSISDVGSAYAHSRLDLKSATDQLAHTKKGTIEHEQALLTYRDALKQNMRAREEYSKQAKDIQTSANTELIGLRKIRDMQIADGKSGKELAGVNAAIVAAQNKSAAATSVAARAYAGMVPLTNQATQAIGKLARTAGGAAISKKISLKFEDPGQVQRVANNARNTLKAGVPSRVVTKIVADSRNAEEAIRRLNRAKVKAITVRILEHGGQATLRRIQQIVGTRLAPKVQRILASDASARTKIKQLIALGIPPKIARLLGNDSRAREVISRLAHTSLKPLVQPIRGDASAAYSAIRSLASTSLKPLTQVINISKRGGKATGKRAGEGATDAWVGEGSNWRGAREYVANAKTGAVTRVDRPTILPLSKDDAVIPTEQRYRDRGRDIFKEIARELNIPGFKRGRNPAASPRAISRAHAEARARIKKRTQPNHYSTDNVRELQDVEKAKRNEDNFRDVVTREAGQLEGKEPTTYLRVAGKDASGDPLYEIDQGAIDWWAGQLETMARRFDELVQKIRETADAVAAAFRRLGDPYNDADANPNTVIGRARYNIKQLLKLIGDENNIIKRKGVSKSAIGRAKERIRTYEAALSDERGYKDAAISDWKQMDNERNEIGDETRGRLAEALDSAAQYRTDKAALPSKAAAEREAANPKAEAAEIADPFAAQNNALAALSAEQSLAQIGQGIAGQPARSAEAINADILAQNQGIINQANAMLRDADASNDQSAYSALSQAAQAIAGLGGSAGSPGFAAGQQMAYSSARSDLYKNFGSNFALASSFGTASGMFSGGGYAYGVNPAMGAGVGAGGSGFIFNQVFQQMPDPHTWSQGVKFELQAAM